MKSIEEQISAIENGPWSQFSVVSRGERFACWEGSISPQRNSLSRIRVGYLVPLPIRMWTILEVQPRVQILEPKLERHADYEEGPIPHVYPNSADPSLPFLCLFDPRAGEWSPSDLIAETTLYWAAKWLYFYDGWLITKTWRGGGKHYYRTAKEIGSHHP